MANLRLPQGFKVSSNEKITYYFKDRIITEYEDILIKKADDIAKHISMYISRVSSSLSTRGPIKRIPFYETDKTKLFEITGISEKMLLTAAKDSKLLDTAKKTGQDYKIIGNSFNLLCALIIIVYFKHKDEFKYKNKNAYPYYKLVSLFLTISFYSWIYIRQFQFDPDEAIMDYTMENLSNKYIIKKVNNIFELNKYWSESNIENMMDHLNRQADIDLIYFISNLFSRISQSMINISKEFYKNYEDKKRNDTDTLMKTDEEGDNYLNDVRNISNDIEITSRKIQLSFISDTSVDLKLLELACSKRQVSKSKMAVIITKIRESDDTLVLDLIKQIISYYLQSSNSNIKSIKSQKFVTQMLKVYTISNTTNQFKINMTNILDTLFKKYSEEYLKTSRVATLSNMRSSLYIYFVLYISKNIE